MGITIAVRSDTRPDQTWPWKRDGDAWILRPNPAANLHFAQDEDAYRSTYGWTPGRSSAARQMVIIVAALCSCVMLALTLWRSRWNLLALGAFVLVFCTGFALWRARQPDVMSMRIERR